MSELTEESKTQDYPEWLIENWKKYANEPWPWISSAKINKYIADLLYGCYEESWIKYEKKLSNFKGSEITEVELMEANLGKSVLMFYGLALECYLKAVVIDKKLIKPILRNKKGKLELNNNLANHNLLRFFELIFGKANKGDGKFLDKLKTAIESGKYPFQKKAPTKFGSYMSDLEESVLFSNNTIKKLIERLSNADWKSSNPN